MKELKKYFHIKLSAIKEQFTEENEKLAKRIEIDLQPKLLYRSNQVQYELGNSAVAQLDDLLKLLKKQSIKKTLKMRKNLTVDIKSRNKLITIADKSPGRWKTLDEYVSDSLASD